jgi:hypothetical protein
MDSDSGEVFVIMLILLMFVAAIVGLGAYNSGQDSVARMWCESLDYNYGIQEGDAVMCWNRHSPEGKEILE